MSEFKTKREAEKKVSFYEAAAREWREQASEAQDPAWFEQMAKWNEQHAARIRDLLPTLPDEVSQ